MGAPEPLRVWKIVPSEAHDDDERAGRGAMESYDYLSDLSRSTSGSSTDSRVREAHAAMVELDRERGEPVCVWHAGCNTSLMTSCLTTDGAQKDTTEPRVGAA
jgi:hypothetical protein